jgi:dihydropteroate synthase
MGPVSPEPTRGPGREPGPADRPSHILEFADGGRLALGEATAVMGVINVTPDSFHEGSRVHSPGAAAEAAAAMLEAGAALIDVGGESTRPGAAAVPVEEELERTIPAVRRIKASTRGRVSVDTRRAIVARAALDAGADLINDVSGLADPAMLPLLAQRRVPVVIMHMRGEPATMQDDTRYDDVVREVRDWLARRVESAVALGLTGAKILVDPGIGFGKSAAGSLELLRRLPELAAVGRPLLVGASRKSFIGKVLGLGVGERLEASLAVAVWAAARGAHVIRAHEVQATVRALSMLDAVRRGAAGAGEARGAGLAKERGETAG